MYIKRMNSSKGQSIIIQFTLFFVIGLGIFIGSGMVFRARGDAFRDETSPICARRHCQAGRSLANRERKAI